MRKFLLAAILCVAVFSAKAQVLSFKNNTNCTLYTVMLADFGCPGFYHSKVVAIPANSLTQFNINTFTLWDGASPTLTGEKWMAVKLFGSSLCSSGGIIVGQAACPTSWPTFDAMTMNTACNACPVIKANWVGSGTNCTVDIN